MLVQVERSNILLMKVVNEKPASTDLREKRNTVEIREQMRSELKLKAKVRVRNAHSVEVDAR